MGTTAYSTLRQGVSKLDNSYVDGSTTTNIAANNTVVDTKLAGIGFHTADSLAMGCWMWLNTTLNANIEKTISANTAGGSLTVRGTALKDESTSQSFEIHRRFRPTDIHAALEDARHSEYPYIHKQVLDTTLYTFPNQTWFTVPTGLRTVDQVLIENRLSPNFDANILYKEGYSVDFSGWTVATRPNGSDAATNITLSEFTKTGQNESFIYGRDGSMAKCVSSGAGGSHYWTALSTPANYAGQTLTYEEEIYCTNASEVKVTIVDSAGSTVSSFHGGTGLERVRVTHTVTAAPTSLTCGITTAGTTKAFYRKKAILTRAENYVENCWTPIDTFKGVFNGNLRFSYPPPEGYFLMCIGRAPLTTRATDATTVEIDGDQLRILYTAALLKLYRDLENRHADQSTNPYTTKVLLLERQLQMYRNMYGMSIPLSKQEPMM